uniref:Ubiquitin-conjugating enzyme E2 U n=2 Tax=Pipistrellus kuhlii TaxID=59472 RepID=A0A7J8AD00_PIPKU|nr:ubiquitin conjugating enzyme E2 U [Pipistrellus kuhlii]
MCCRTYYLLQRDLRELEENKYKGIVAFPVSEDQMTWEARIEGLKDTIWQGILLRLTITFTPEYNLAPPVVKFKTIPFHPNVDQNTGQPCIDFLDNPRKWKASYTLSSILLTLQVMLSNPVLEKPVNLEAAQILTESESMYKLIIQKIYRDTLLLDQVSSYSSEDSDKLIKAIKISFDDYHKTWSEIATSKAAECFRTPMLQNPAFLGHHHKWKKMERKHQKEWNLKYAAAKAQYARETKTSYKVQSQSSRIYPSPVSESQSESEIVLKTYLPEDQWEDYGDHIHDPWEEEVEELVNWANTLDSDVL